MLLDAFERADDVFDLLHLRHFNGGELNLLAGNRHLHGHIVTRPQNLRSHMRSWRWFGCLGLRLSVQKEARRTSFGGASQFLRFLTRLMSPTVRQVI